MDFIFMNLVTTPMVGNKHVIVLQMFGWVTARSDVKQANLCPSFNNEIFIIRSIYTGFLW